MHFNFHLSGDESPEQSRRIANAVLALGGLTSATFESAPTVTHNVVSVGQAFAGFAEAVASRAVPMDAQLTEDDLPLNPPPYTEAEQFGGALTGDEIRAVESLPPAPPVPTTSTVAPSGLDAKGLPWDERIHSSSRAINADGTWRYRKNVPDETKRDVEAELRGLVQGPQLTEADLPPAAPPVPVPPLPPAPPVPTVALQRTYSDVVNLIMARKVQPDTYVAILGMSLPEFAKHVISAPNDATLMFDALDAASRSA